jgi:hypothetical protein
MRVGVAAAAAVPVGVPPLSVARATVGVPDSALVSVAVSAVAVTTRTICVGGGPWQAAIKSVSRAKRAVARSRIVISGYRPITTAVKLELFMGRRTTGIGLNRAIVAEAGADSSERVAA